LAGKMPSYIGEELTPKPYLPLMWPVGWKEWDYNTGDNELKTDIAH